MKQCITAKKGVKEETRIAIWNIRNCNILIDGRGRIQHNLEEVKNCSVIESIILRRKHPMVVRRR